MRPGTRVLFVHRGADLASARVRVLQLLPHLSALGVEGTAVPFPRSPSSLAKLLATRDVDVVVLQKKAPTAVEALAWRACRVPIVFDFDDALPFRQSPRGGSHDSPTRRRRFARALSLANAFACGNEYLASLCRPRGRPVAVVPSAVPLEVPRAEPLAGEGPVRIGWLGAPHNFAELRSLEPALRDLAQRRDFVLVVVSEEPFEMPGVPVEHVPWQLASQEEEIARLDVGVMPLVDSPWTRGKCAYKLLQYMAAGVPAVASPVGMNTEVVRHGENGFLAESPSQWVRALDELASDPALARRLGDAGRRTVEADFGYDRVAGLWKGLLAEVPG